MHILYTVILCLILLYCAVNCHSCAPDCLVELCMVVLWFKHWNCAGHFYIVLYTVWFITMWAAMFYTWKFPFLLCIILRILLMLSYCVLPQDIWIHLAKVHGWTNVLCKQNWTEECLWENMLLPPKISYVNLLKVVYNYMLNRVGSIM